jgi:surface polysaccharide O-acyltransferase-like enzyme
MQSAASSVSHPTATDVQPRSTGRLLFIDNIRVFLTILVLMHHLMVLYAGTGDWYIREGQPDTVTTAVGALFCAVNQAYFMGLFLLISAYFVPGSYDRKGAGRFLKDRLVRLGIPLAIYSWILNPLFIYALYYNEIHMPFWRYFPIDYFKHNAWIGSGPLWFVEVLLIFSLVYVVWRLATRSRPASAPAETRFPSNGRIALFALLLGLAGFVVRLAFAIDRYTFGPLNLQLAFFAQYIALFVVGLIAYRRNWLMGLPDKAGRLWLGLAGLLILLWAPLMLLGGALTTFDPYRGGLHWQALAWALWESFLCMGMCIAVVYLFRRYLNRRGKLSGFLVPNAYTAYIIHAPIITGVALAMRGLMWYPLLKWALAVLIAVPLAFLLSSLIRKIPYADRVL